MKKAAIAVLVLLGLLLAGFVGWLGAHSGAGTPGFQPVSSQAEIGSARNIQYEFLDARPFEGGKMWISIFGGTNKHHCFLYDIERQTISGELINAGPIFLNREQSILFCIQRTQTTWLGRTWSALAQMIRHPKGRSHSPAKLIDILWALDLKRNSATRMGKTENIQSAFQSSPTFRYGFVKPFDPMGNGGFLLCDLEARNMTRVNLDGLPQAWWDESNIVIKDPTNNFALYNVSTGGTSQLWSSAQIAGFFSKLNIHDEPANANFFSVWNGKANDLYITDLHKKWQGAESYLLKVERTDRTLSLVSPNFKFEWSDHLDSTGSWYLYSGRESGHASSAVFLRDLRNNTEHTLVASDGGKNFSIPRFYRDGAIYIRSNMLWRVGLNGSNQTRIFPPPTH